MDYARVEMLLVRGAWPRGISVRGAVAGPALAVIVDPNTRMVTHTVVQPRRMRQLRAAEDGYGISADDRESQNGVSITASTRVRGVNASLGVLTRVWVDRASSCVTHVVIRRHMGVLASGPERIVPIDRVEEMRLGTILVKLDSTGFSDMPVFRSDSLIERDVNESLAAVLAEPRARRTLKVRVQDGFVTLGGEVDTLDQVRYAEHTVMRVPGVRGITLDLVAQEALAAAVEARLALQRIASGDGPRSIQVLAEHGIVHLEGTVGTQRARSDAERVALTVAGVKVVVNNLRVDGESPERAGDTGPLVRNR
jgi:osmotically-inducible protein OsmY